MQKMRNPDLRRTLQKHTNNTQKQEETPRGEHTTGIIYLKKKCLYSTSKI